MRECAICSKKLSKPDARRKYCRKCAKRAARERQAMRAADAALYRQLKRHARACEAHAAQVNAIVPLMEGVKRG